METKYCKAIDFCLNFSKDDIKKVLPDILEEFVNQYSEKYRDYIMYIGNSVRWIFYNKMSDLMLCFSTLEKRLLYGICINFFQSLGLNNIGNIDDLRNNTIDIPYISKIVEILNSNNISSFESYQCLMTLDNPIKNYLIEFLSKCNEQEASTIKNCLSKLEEMENEYENIHKRYENYFKLSLEYMKINSEFKIDLERKIVKSIEFLLSDKDKEYISNNKDFEICNLDAHGIILSCDFEHGKFKSKILNSNISINDMKKILNYLGCDYKEEDLSDYNKFLNVINNEFFSLSNTNKFPYHILSILTEGKCSDLNVYNYMNSLIQSCDMLYRKKEKDEIFSVTNKEMYNTIFNEYYSDIKSILLNFSGNIFKTIRYYIKVFNDISKVSEEMLGDLTKKESNNPQLMNQLIISICKQQKLTNLIFINKSDYRDFYNHDLISNTVHEFGHAFSSSLLNDIRYKVLVEIINEYVILKVLEGLYDNNKNPYSDTFFYSDLNGLAYRLFFLLEPFKEYIHIFKEMHISGDIKTLEDFMRKDNFEDYIDLLNESWEILQLKNIHEIPDIHDKLDKIVKRVFEYNESAKKKEIH